MKDKEVSLSLKGPPLCVVQFLVLVLHNPQVMLSVLSAWEVKRSRRNMMVGSVIVLIVKYERALIYTMKLINLSDVVPIIMQLIFMIF